MMAKKYIFETVEQIRKNKVVKASDLKITIYYTQFLLFQVY